LSEFVLVLMRNFCIYSI